MASPNTELSTLASGSSTQTPASLPAVNPDPTKVSTSKSPNVKPTENKKDKGKDKAGPPGSGASSGATPGGKDAKKEKRAAAVAARIAAGGSVGGPSADAPGAGPSGSGQRPQNGSAGQGQRGANPNSSASTSAQAQPQPSTTTAPISAPPSQSLLFSHLPRTTRPTTSLALLSTRIHPLCIRYGLLISNGVIRGANARVIGLMNTFKEVIRDFECSKEEMHRLLPSHLSPMIGWLDGCRPKGVGGGNAIRYLKSEINRIGTLKSLPDHASQKHLLLESIDEFLRDRIELADEVISGFAGEKIRKGSVVVTYARSSIIEKVLLDAWRLMQEDDPSDQFSVIVVDSGPLFEGKHLLKVLQSSSIPCTYTLLPSLPSVISRAVLVLLGTAALLSDGAMYSRAGTAMVALLAKENRIPVVACCETYKFGEKVVLDAVTGNELGDTKDWWDEPILDLDPVARRKTKAVDVTPIHLLYDLTPASLITAVCTEVGFIPPSSVPTVIVKGDDSAL